MQVIGIDLGNITTVVVSDNGVQVFESRTEKADAMDKMTSDFDIITTLEGEKAINKGEFENNLYKYDKKNFIDLLHYGVANNMRVDKDTNVKLSVGIPANQYSSFKDELKNKIMSNNKVDMSINGVSKKALITDVVVTPEGYGVYKSTDKKLLIPTAMTLVIDIGGGTTDLAFFSADGKFIKGDSVDVGLLELYGVVQSKIQNGAKLYESVENIKEYYRGNLSFIGIDDSHKLQPTLDLYDVLYNRVVAKCPNIKSYNVIVCGGGAEVFGKLFKQNLPQTIIDEDVEVNAKVFKKRGDQLWKETK